MLGKALPRGVLMLCVGLQRSQQSSKQSITRHRTTVAPLVRMNNLCDGDNEDIS